jgi:hypothetical protein
LSFELLEVDRRNLVGFKLTEDLFHSRGFLDVFIVVSLLRLEPGDEAVSSVFAGRVKSDASHSQFEVWKLKLANLGRPVLKDACRLAKKLFLLRERALELGLDEGKGTASATVKEGCALSNAPRLS